MHLQLYKKAFVWRVKLVGKNGETLMFSEAYFSKGNAQRALTHLHELLQATSKGALKIGVGR